MLWKDGRKWRKKETVIKRYGKKELNREKRKKKRGKTVDKLLWEEGM